MITQQNGSVYYAGFQQYQSFPEVVHGAFTRLGGQSPVPYQSLNTIRLGDSVENVVHNRQAILQTLDMDQAPVISLWQVHGADVFTYVAQEEWRTDWGERTYFERPWSPTTIRQGDALITRERGVALALSFADCVPITFYDPIHQAIGIAHGGWRGTARGVVIATVEAMTSQFGSQPAELYAGIGPAIGSCCYEVSEEVHQIFMGERDFDTMPINNRYRSMIQQSATFSVQQQDGQASLRLDLQETNRLQLQLAGLPPEHIEMMRICTSCNCDQYFSHRGEQGQTGRFAVIMALRK